MKILVACEESQAVTIELRKLGHEAYSCDIIPCSGGHPEWHLQSDVIPLINGDCAFFTDDGASHYQFGTWDMIIAFPPCTYFSTAGANWLFRGGKLDEARYAKGLEMKWLFLNIYNAPCERIAIENPVPMKIWELPICTQEIQPWQFGEPYTKKTRLWLKGLPLLSPTNVVEPQQRWVSSGYKGHSDNAVCKSGGSKKKRAKTFPGIARAMAEQWGGAV
jgi:hypothetical protein